MKWKTVLAMDAGMTTDSDIKDNLDIPNFLRRQRDFYPTVEEMSYSLKTASRILRGRCMESKRNH